MLFACRVCLFVDQQACAQIVTSVSYPNEEEMAKGHAEMEAACK